MKAETQGSSLLGRIVAHSEERVLALREAGSAFGRSLRGSHVAIIAEVKRRSPSAGDIRPGASAGELAADYLAAGAAAISVLTEDRHFGGSLDDLAEVARLGSPVLRKDFLVDEAQIAEARERGAAAVLLIVRILPRPRLEAMLHFSALCGLDALVEVHHRAELDTALEAGARIVGVNARDLDTLAMNETVFEELLPRIPESVVRIAESGMRNRGDIERVAALGADAALVGTALAGAERPGDVLRTLTGVTRG